ncbi:hypothetical protein ACG02S_18955 [Roseateles sp. DC23W]|uniref:Uncharacterized protein n=1 Tax=Pelomonas dachongensis TaxID=3299029 RepID=A0ABW7ER60_9BURK
MLAKDTVGGAAARAGSGGNATVTFSGALPAGVTATEGVVAVARGTAPGSYTLNYQLCEAAAATNCQTASVALTVPVPVIRAVADTATLGVGETASLLTNDLLDGIAATPTTVVATATGT